MTTTDSNLWGGNSGHTYTYTLTRRPAGPAGRPTSTPPWSVTARTFEETRNATPKTADNT